jgi:hypothetical protein
MHDRTRRRSHAGWLRSHSTPCPAHGQTPSFRRKPRASDVRISRGSRRGTRGSDGGGSEEAWRTYSSRSCRSRRRRWCGWSDLWLSPCRCGSRFAMTRGSFRFCGVQQARRPTRMKPAAESRLGLRQQQDEGGWRVPVRVGGVDAVGVGVGVASRWLSWSAVPPLWRAHGRLNCGRAAKPSQPR